jgi:antitoxin (DNA-binding transcriptional repressor) of toxin-antitoxin stability system
MDPVNIHEAKTRLSQRVDRAASGGDVVIGPNGRPLVHITRLDAAPRVRLGVLAGRFDVPDDLDAPLPDAVLATFEAR